VKVHKFRFQLAVSQARAYNDEKDYQKHIPPPLGSVVYILLLKTLPDSSEERRSERNVFLYDEYSVLIC